MDLDEELGEQKEIPGEGGKIEPPTFVIDQVIVEKKLTFEEASRCLNTLGKDESGIRYAYLMISATDRNLTNVDIILNFKHILFIDVSGNYLTLDSLQVLADIPYLVLLKAERNRVESAALGPMHFLQGECKSCADILTGDEPPQNETIRSLLSYANVDSLREKIV